MENRFDTFGEILKLSLQIEHYESQRRNTFSLEEREDCTKNIKIREDSIDKLLDDYNVSKKVQKVA